MSASRRVYRWVFAVLCVAAACGGATAPPAGFPHSAATPACGPTDGPAVAIYLTSVPLESAEPEAPYVRVYLWEALNRLAGRSWVIAGDEPAGSAWFHRSASDFEVARSGRVTVASVAPDNTIEGSVDLRFPEFGRVRGTFRAVWIPGNPLCI